jgi:hypothetical protein
MSRSRKIFDDSVIQPPLRYWQVIVRGGLYGLPAIGATALVTAAVSDHDDRTTFIAVVWGLSLIFGTVLLVTGSFLWLCSLGDIRRFRDFRTLKGLFGAVSIGAPIMVRLGSLGLVLAAGATGIVKLVDPTTDFF